LEDYPRGEEFEEKKESKKKARFIGNHKQNEWGFSGKRGGRKRYTRHHPFSQGKMFWAGSGTSHRLESGW